MSSTAKSPRLALVRGTKVEFGDERTVVRLIEAQAARVPNDPAITFGDVTLTYREVDRRANALAGQLRDAGAGHGDFVPLLMTSGLEVPIGMIAAMKLGAPFVPMDVDWPAARIMDMVRAMAPPVVLCAGGTPPAELPAVITVDATTLPESDPGDLGPPAGLDDLAYGFYTSGSTGKPKCALNVHRGLRNRFFYMNKCFPERAGEVVLQTSTHVFDPTLWQLLWPLTNGSRTVVPRSTGLIDLASIIEVIERHQVTITDLVPSVFNVLVEMIDAEPSMAAHLRSVRDLVIGGEEMQAAAVQRFRALVPHVRITNTYGPTEAAIGMMFHEVRDADQEVVPIGLPIDNTCAAIVDGDMRPVQTGVVGHLYIGGECLGRGYLNEPAKTAAAFVDNPFAGLGTRRLYRTGDLAYLREDGLIGFRGRQDDQVKIAGLRVELGEIGTVLRAHPEVSEAKVVVHTEAEDKRLIAFVTTRGPVGPAELLDHARATLPAYMVPARITVLDAMPLLPNGKLDGVELARRASDRGTPAPAARNGDAISATERALAEIWTELLAMDPVTRSDNFFALGGDSLGAQRMVLAVKKRLGVGISIRDVVRAPDLAALAARIAGGGAAAGDSPGRDLELPDDIRAAAPPLPGPPAHVLLTGATGFVGAQLLHDLLTTTSANVHCLVRAPDVASGRRRLCETLAEYQLISRTPLDRMRVVPSDLTKPRLGIGEQTYEMLAETVDVIVHCGAVVNLVLDYAYHRKANVHGTREILRLAARRRTKPVHYISTLSVFGPAAYAGRMPIPELPAPDIEPPPDGYSLSKWVGEQLVVAAGERGVPLAVYRLGEVMPHSGTGVPNPRSLPDMLVGACLRLGVAPASPVVLDYTPIDYVGQMITAGVTTGASGVFHVLPPQAMLLNELLDSFSREFDLRTVSYREFWTMLEDAAQTGDPVYTRLLAAVPAAGADVDDATLLAELTTMFQDGSRVFSTARAAVLRAQNGMVSAPTGDEAVGRYVAYHRRLMRTVAPSATH
ncbi:amino acid adenylation domain-containing protein [Kibdelosporangium persicum]|uniref:Non-ribosomal siderophore peptide synthetase n=1 Tax=Kibdelosporangium persicum TaxID=2698649 RepID=A0ABX2FHE2_9PSEU|nr:amino acid adenylation domain-containing protein [Kibdelosporangium persicum]NRN70687.1 Non-ribosomal siderophore peptide synthetase [Kibdelosporangium persicum]